MTVAVTAVHPAGLHAPVTGPWEGVDQDPPRVRTDLAAMIVVIAARGPGLETVARNMARVPNRARFSRSRKFPSPFYRTKKVSIPSRAKSA